MPDSDVPTPLAYALAVRENFPSEWQPVVLLSPKHAKGHTECQAFLVIDGVSLRMQHEVPLDWPVDKTMQDIRRVTDEAIANGDVEKIRKEIEMSDGFEEKTDSGARGEVIKKLDTESLVGTETPKFITPPVLSDNGRTIAEYMAAFFGERNTDRHAALATYLDKAGFTRYEKPWWVEEDFHPYNDENEEFTPYDPTD